MNSLHSELLLNAVQLNLSKVRLRSRLSVCLKRNWTSKAGSYRDFFANNLIVASSLQSARYWALYSSLSPPSGSNRANTLVNNSWLHLNSASHPFITSFCVPTLHSAPYSFHRSFINSTQESNIYHLNSYGPPCSVHTLLLLKLRKKTPGIQLTHTKNLIPFVRG